MRLIFKMKNSIQHDQAEEDKAEEEVAEEKPALLVPPKATSKTEKTPAKSEMAKSPMKTPASAVRRIRVNSSSSNSEDTAPRRCVVAGCKSDARANSVYCSDACIGTHARESLIAMSKEKIKQVNTKLIAKLLFNFIRFQTNLINQFQAV